MPWIKKVYLYVVSLISLVILVVAAIMLINLALKAWVFKKADQNIVYPQPQCMAVDLDKPDAGQNCNGDYSKQQADQRSAQKQRDAAQAIAMIIVATPVFLYHWRLARRES